MNDRVSIDTAAFLRSQDGPTEWSAEELARAREELVDELLAGDKVGDVQKVDLETILDAAIDSNPAGMARNLYEHLANIGGIRDHGEHCQKASAWMRQLIESYVDAHDDLISDRAADNENARKEDAELWRDE